MAVTSMLRVIRRIGGRAFPACFLFFALLGIGASDARADFIGYYSPGNFTLTNTFAGFDPGTGDNTANGSAVFPNLLTLVLTGTNDGSGVPAWTDLTIPAAADGFFQFSYAFTANVPDPNDPTASPAVADPHTQYACALVGSNTSCDPLTPDQFFLADRDGQIGTFKFSVTAGESIGFRVGGDGQGGIPGVLTVTNFSAPVPEPGTFQLLLIAAAATVGGFYRKKIRARRS